jgi:hypothetical protein
MNINVEGAALGSHDASLGSRLGFTAAMAGAWKSDSSIRTKVSAGVGRIEVLTVSSGRNVRGHLIQDRVMNMATPEISSLNAVDNRTLSVLGSSMGVDEPQRIVSYYSTHHLQGNVPHEIAVFHTSEFSKNCRAVDVQMKLLLENFSRVDGLTISLISPLGVTFPLIKNRCQGCYKQRIQIQFSDGASSTIPNSNCVDGYYRFDHFPVLRELLLGSDGYWTIVAAAGLARDFVTLSIRLDIHVQDYIGLINSKQRSVFDIWSSDSGLAMIRGTLNAQESIPNIIISGQIGQNKAGSILAEYKPALAAVSCLNFPETGSGMITIIGIDLAQAVFVGDKTWEGFDRASLSAVAKTGKTSCESSPWQSQSSILCKTTGRPLSDFLSVALTVARAASTFLLELPELDVN